MILEAQIDSTVPPETSFESAALPLRSFLFSKAMKLTGNATDADDLLQDTYMLGMRKFHMYRKGTNLKAWLARLQFNLFVSGYRRRRNRPDGVRLVDVGDTVTDKSFTNKFEGLESLQAQEISSSEVFVENLSQEMKHGLDDLDTRYRDVLLLSTVGEKSYQDIANTLRLPVGTVMSRLSRAKSHMREFFANNVASAS